MSLLALTVRPKMQLATNSAGAEELSFGPSECSGSSTDHSGSQADDSDREICAWILTELAAGAALGAPNRDSTEDRGDCQAKLPRISEILQNGDQQEYNWTVEPSLKGPSYTSDTPVKSEYVASPPLTASDSPGLHSTTSSSQASPMTPAWNFPTSLRPHWHPAILGVMPGYPHLLMHGAEGDQYHSQQLVTQTSYNNQVERRVLPGPGMSGVVQFHHHAIPTPRDKTHRRGGGGSTSRPEFNALRPRYTSRVTKSSLPPQSNPTPVPATGRPPPRTPHCNRPYGDEHADFIMYQRIDLQRRWDDIVAPFAAQFPLEPRRTVGGLQSLYYRKNGAAPEIDDHGDAVLDPRAEDATVVIRARKVREGGGRWGLVARWPERVVEKGYAWVRKEHMEAARKLVLRRCQQLAEHAARVRQDKTMVKPRL